MTNYHLTHHLRERFVQRSDVQYRHLEHCKEKRCEICQKAKQSILSKVKLHKREIDSEINRRINSAKENRSYINNSGFMLWYYEKYGYEKRFQFLVDDDILFVVVIDKGKYVVVTCIISKTHLVGRNASRKKFKKH